jgi:hypothetical protein
MKGDMGIKAKQLKSLVTNCVNMFGALDIGMVCTAHTYESQDMFDPTPKVSGGNGFVYASSILVAMKKLKLKEDESGNKTTSVQGIRAACSVMKTRYSKPFENIKLDIPYSTGMNPVSGLFDMFLESGKLVKQGIKYKYITKDGKEMLYYRKDWNDFEKMKVIMDEFSQEDLNTSKNLEASSEDDILESEKD